MHPDKNLPTTVTATLVLLCIAAAVGAYLTWAVIAVAHVDDRYLVSHVSGTRMALVQSFEQGTLYGPFFDGTHYRGTRIMPLPVVLHALAARLTGEYLRSGKLVGYTTLLALLTAVFLLLRRLRCPVPIVLIVAASLLLTQPGYRAGFAMLWDPLPALLQLVAVSLVLSAIRMRVLLAAGLSALAFAAKLSALWAPIAIGVWLAVHQRRQLLPFALVYLALIGIFAMTLSLLSSGYFLENFVGHSLAGVDGAIRAIRSPAHLLRVLYYNTPALWALAPAGAAAVVISAVQRRLSIYDIALLCCLPILLVVFADVGADANHLLDVAVLLALVIGRAAARDVISAPGVSGGPIVTSRAWSLTPVQAGVGVLFLWVTVTHLMILRPDLHEARLSLTNLSTESARPLQEWIGPEATILSEDPYLPISRGQTPVVADPFILARVALRDPDAVQPLVQRIESREFDYVVLIFPLHQSDWWERFSFGRAVIQAVETHYRFVVYAEQYYVYERRPG